MSTTYLRAAAALLTAIALSAAPASAQRRHDEGGRRAGGNEGARRGAPRGDGGEQRQAQPRREPRVDERRGDGGNIRGNDANRDNRGFGGSRNGLDNERRAVPRYDGRRDLPRYDGRRDLPRYDGRRDLPRYDGRRDDRRVVPYRDSRPRVVIPQYRYRAYPRRSYVVPYGYRPYGYRPGWSLNMYFGRPYVGGYYTDRSYGYYSLPSGFAYGSLRIVDAPRDARVYVDGYYAGVVDDYDGVFQHLNLEPGAHHIEIEIDPGVEPIAFDVRIEPGETVTFHARDYY
jgi:hypothetical protein